MKYQDSISAVRRIRHEISESVGHDSKRLVEYYQSRQRRHSDRLVSRRGGFPESKESSPKVAEEPGFYGSRKKD
jgi:hypothetical protein